MHTHPRPAAVSCIRWLAANPEVNAREHHGHGHSHGHSHNGGTPGQGHGHGHTIVDVSASGKHATVQDVVVAAGGGGGNPVVTANPLAGAAGVGSSSTDATGSIKGGRGGGRQSVLARTTGKRAHKAKVPSFTAEELAVMQQRGQQDPVDPRSAKVEVHTQQQQQHHHLVLLVRLVSGLTSRHCGVCGCPLPPSCPSWSAVSTWSTSLCIVSLSTRTCTLCASWACQQGRSS